MIYIIAVYAVVTFIFLLWSAFAAYHSFAFGFKGDKTKPVCITYSLFVIAALAAQVYFLFTISWFELL